MHCLFAGSVAVCADGEQPAGEGLWLQWHDMSERQDSLLLDALLRLSNQVTLLAGVTQPAGECRCRASGCSGMTSLVARQLADGCTAQAEQPDVSVRRW